MGATTCSNMISKPTSGFWGSNGEAVMFRKELIKMLHGNPMTVSQIARLVDESPGHVADDLNHLLRSLKHTEYKAVVEPARCRSCGFEFSEEKLTKPSKCPECHGTWLLEPKIGIADKIGTGKPPST